MPRPMRACQLAHRAKRQAASEQVVKPGVAEGVQVVEDREDGRENDLDQQGDGEVGQGFAEEERGRWSGGEALGFEDVVAELTGPGAVQCGESGEEQADPEQAAANLAGDGGVRAGVEGEREDDDNEEREEEHAVDRYALAPLQLEVLAEMEKDRAGRGRHEAMIAGGVRERSKREAGSRAGRTNAC